MEKGTPHCKLQRVKALIQAGRVRAAFSALSGGAALGLDFDRMIGVVMALRVQDFYKSLTTRADHHIRQDVYRSTTAMGRVHLKLTVIHDVLIVSFKEL